MVFAQHLDRGRRSLLQGREQRLLLEQHVLEQAFAQPGEVLAIQGPAAGSPGGDHGVELALELCVLHAQRKVQLSHGPQDRSPQRAFP
jgi:hypothetical protein